MASYKLYLDTRKRKGNEPVPVSIIISHKNRTAHIGTGVKVLPEEIDMTDTKNNGKVMLGENKSRKSAVISSKKMQVQRCILELIEQKVIDKMSVQDIKKYIESNGDVITTSSTSFASVLEMTITSAKSDHSKSNFRSFSRHFSEFTNMDELCFDNITPILIKDFDRFMEKKGISINSRANYMRLFRIVINNAIKHEITNNYPFARFKIKTEQTRKRNLSADTIRKLIGYEMKLRSMDIYRDMFMLSFCLIGINNVDLYNLKDTDIHEGRIEYRRAKTGKHYSIKIEPEAQAIINKYKGNDGFLLNLHERFDILDKFQGSVTHGLKEIRSDLTMYWARHSWASIAYELGFSTDIIAQALGHSVSGHAVTAIYINPDQRKVDEANRKVIDYVYYNTNNTN